MDTFYSTQLQWISALQVKNALIEHFFKALHFFDQQEFFFILIPIFFGYYWKSGLRFFYLIMISGLVNYAMKQVFHEPRPFHLDPSIGLIYVSGYGFPSGAAQTAILLSGVLLNHLRNKWGWIIAINYVFWVSLSRIYLGVHFPTDVLGGWIIGVLLWTAYTYLEPPLERSLSRRKPASLLFISIFIPVIIAYLGENTFVLQFCIPMIGISIGTFISHRHHLLLPRSQNHREFFKRAAFTILGTFVIYTALERLHIGHTYLRIAILTFFPALWISLGATSILKWMSRE